MNIGIHRLDYIMGAARSLAPLERTRGFGMTQLLGVPTPVPGGTRALGQSRGHGAAAVVVFEGAIVGLTQQWQMRRLARLMSIMPFFRARVLARIIRFGGSSPI